MDKSPAKIHISTIYLQYIYNEWLNQLDQLHSDPLFT